MPGNARPEPRLPHRQGAAVDLILSLEALPIVVPSRGSKLIGGSVRTELTREEVRNTLVEGFFPEVAADARPA